MTPPDPKGEALRRQAEAARRPQSGAPLDPDPTRLIHELEVYQLELELQNEELLRANVAAERARVHYTHLFDFTPVACLRVARSGVIEELNLAAARLLGEPRSALAGQPLPALFDDPSMVEGLLARTFEAVGGEVVGNAILGLGSRSPLELRLHLASEDSCLVALVDRTEQSRAEEISADLAAELKAMAGLRAVAVAARAPELSGTLADILDTALAVTGAQHGAVLLPRADGHPQVVAQRGFPADTFLRGFSKAEPSLWSSAVVERRRVVVTDIATLPWAIERDPLLAAGIRCAQVTPLLDPTSEVQGFLCTFHTTPQPGLESRLGVLDVLTRLAADAVAQERMMADLREAEAMHRQFLGAVPDPVIIVSDTGRIVYANEPAERTFGYAPGELAGQVHEVLIPEELRGLHREHSANYRREPGPRRMETRGAGRLWGLRKDRSRFPIEASLNTLHVRGEVLVSTVVRDITDRLALEAQARHQAERLDAAIDLLPDAIVVWGRDGTMLACNTAFRSLFGHLFPGAGGLVTRRDLAGRTQAMFLPGPVWFDPNAEGPSELDVRHRDGRRFRVSTRPLPHGGSVTSGIDRTADLHREEELRLARTQAEVASRAKSEFLTSVSHELRTPLNSVLGFSQLLIRDQRDRLTDRQRERVEYVLRSGEQLLALIDDMLDLTSLESPQLSIQTEAVAVPALVAEAVQGLLPVAAQAEVTLLAEKASADLPPVAADPRRLLQIVLNLCSNAIKYNRTGGTVTVSATRATTRLVRITVVDTGRGIPLEHQARLFEPFHRAGQESGPIQGTGIGLVICRRLAELMGGSVGFESVPGIGSTFWVDLPIHRTLGQPSRAPRVVPRSGRGCSGFVVCVEDNPTSQVLLRSVFETLPDVEVTIAGTAEEGLRVIRARRPDLVLMDLFLPGMSGFEALAALRADPSTRDLPVVAISAAASKEDLARGAAAGFHRYLTKPLRVAELEAVICEVLER